MTVGILSNDSFGRFTFPIVEALERRLFDHGIAVFMCNATDDPMRERSHIEQLGKRVDGLVVTARRADRRAPIEPAARGLPVVYVFSQVEKPGRALPPAGRRGRRSARGQASRRSRPQTHCAYHRPGAFRGGSPARSGLSRGARGSGARDPTERLSPGPIGPRPGDLRLPDDCFPEGAPRRTRFSAATIRSRAAQSTRSARWAVQCRLTSRWWASTIGK